MNRQYNLIVIGAGPGGYEAAIEAAKNQMKVAIVEKDRLGGTCLNRGCIPTKSLLYSAGLYQTIRDSHQWGIQADSVKVDWDQMLRRKQQVIDTLGQGIETLLKKHKIDFYAATAQIVDQHMVLAGEQELTADYLLIATGSVVAKPDLEGAELENVFTSDQLLERASALDHLLIIGGGVIGVEFAEIYHHLGSKVTIIEALNRLVDGTDGEISRSLAMSFQNRGIEVYTGAEVKRIRPFQDRRSSLPAEKEAENQFQRLGCVFEVDGKLKEIDCDAILLATGRKPETKGLFGEALEIELDRNVIHVNEYYQTNYDNIYAIGDVIGGKMLAHKATAEGKNAVAHMQGRPLPVSTNLIPNCIYTQPEIALVGLSVEQAKQQKIPVITRKYPMAANGPTQIHGLERGFVKIIVHRLSHVVLGAVLLCGHATDMINELTLAIEQKLTMEEVAAIIHPHPSFGEGIQEVVRE